MQTHGSSTVNESFYTIPNVCNCTRIAEKAYEINLDVCCRFESRQINGSCTIYRSVRVVSLHLP